jgi:predicted GNAT family acetyltransferase
MENFTVTNNLQNLQFEVDLAGEKAYLEYRWNKSDLALMHTFVPDNYEGKGIAGLLAKTALEYAKKEGLKIIVYCPFVRSYIKRHPEYEVLEKK